MKRLVVTGLPCPAQAWEEFLEDNSTRVISMAEIFEHSESDDPSDLANYITECLQRERPDSILCHGMGVPLTLISLWRLRRAEGPGYQPKVTVFNGAFRHVSLLKSRQPLWIQLLPTAQLVRQAELAGGRVDPGLRRQMGRVRALYRRVILQRAAEKMASVLGLEHWHRIPTGERYRLNLQVIASPNDPFLPVQTMRQLAESLHAQKYQELEYGHYPYSGPREQILSAVQNFEQTSAHQN